MPALFVLDFPLIWDILKDKEVVYEKEVYFRGYGFGIVDIRRLYNGTEYEFGIDGNGQILSWEEEPVRGEMNHIMRRHWTINDASGMAGILITWIIWRIYGFMKMDL